MGRLSHLLEKKTSHACTDNTALNNSHLYAFTTFILGVSKMNVAMPRSELLSGSHCMFMHERLSFHACAIILPFIRHLTKDIFIKGHSSYSFGQ